MSGQNRSFQKQAEAAAAWATPAGLEAVPCRLALGLGRGDHRLSDAAAASDANARLTLPAGTDIRPADAAIVDGRRFEVLVTEPVDRIHRQALGRVQ